jgi:hypothetical protein
MYRVNYVRQIQYRRLATTEGIVCHKSGTPVIVLHTQTTWHNYGICVTITRLPDS